MDPWTYQRWLEQQLWMEYERRAQEHREKVNGRWGWCVFWFITISVLVILWFVAKSVP